MLRIGDFSKLSRISIRMLRHYDEIGLLIPESIDAFTNYRYYSEGQLPVSCRITELKDLGFSLSVISDILQIYNDSASLSQFLIIKQKEIMAQCEETQYRLLLLETAIKRLEKDVNTMNYNVTFKELPERYVASVRKTIPTYEHEGMLWEILMRETAPLNIKDTNPSYTSAVFHDGDYKDSDVDVEVQKSVSGKYKNTENVVFKLEPSIKIASSTYKGSYNQIPDVNQAVANWIKDNGYEFNGSMFNIYHVSPHETKNPDEFVTEICYSVTKK